MDMLSLLPLIDYKLYALKLFANWFVGLTNEHVDWTSIADSVPSVSHINFNDIISSDVYALICDWFPCDWAITCFVSYVVCAITVYGVNWILGLIPTVS